MHKPEKTIEYYLHSITPKEELINGLFVWSILPCYYGNELLKTTQTQDHIQALCPSLTYLHVWIKSAYYFKDENVIHELIFQISYDEGVFNKEKVSEWIKNKLDGLLAKFKIEFLENITK